MESKGHSENLVDNVRRHMRLLANGIVDLIACKQSTEHKCYLEQQLCFLISLIVLCVMHRCIMVKLYVGGKRKTYKVCKNT